MPANVDRDLLTLTGVLLVGAVTALLDTTIVSVAVDDLTGDLRTPVSAAQWVVTSYLLAMAAVIPLMGWLTDRFGARRVWIGTLAVFLTGTLLCSAAWSIESLILFRVVQGAGAGLILPLVQAILADAAGPQRIGRVMGLIGVPGQLAPILGPVLGGFLTGSLGWRWIFLVNVPVCLIAIALAVRHLRPVEVRRRTRLDVTGLVLLGPAVVLLVAGLSGSVWLVAGGAVLLAAFVAHARSGPALLDLSLARGLPTTLVFLGGAVLYGPMLLLPLFFQRERGFTVEQTGLLMVPQGIGLMLALWPAGRWADRHGPRVVTAAGALFLAAGLGVFVGAGDAHLVVLCGGLLLTGIGLAGTGLGASTAAYRGLAPGSGARAASLFSVVQRVGASSGTALVALLPTITGGSPARSLAGFLVLAGVVLTAALRLPSNSSREADRARRHS